MKKGFIFVLVLGLVGVLAFLSITFVQLAGQSHFLTRSHLDSVRAMILARSGVEIALLTSYENLGVNDQLTQTIPLGEGTHLDNGDTITFSYFDANSRINLNDGIQAARLEISHPTFDQPGWEQWGQKHAWENYYVDELNPWPVSEDDPYFIVPEDGFTPRAEDVERYERARSALINLRLRRLLNAYGEAHRYMSHVFESNEKNIKHVDYFRKLPTPPFSTRLRSNRTGSADGRRGYSMEADQSFDLDDYNNGLGDRIIESRPKGGFNSVEEIKDIVNDWSHDSGIELTEAHLKGKSFYELIKNDFTTVSYEDIFYRIDDERRFGNFDDSDQNHHFEEKIYGDFEPQDLQLDPPDFSHMWITHSIPLININQANFYVRAAVFYAPTNLSYSCESATTIPPYTGPIGAGYPFDTNTGLEAMIASPSIGVAPPIFIYEKRKQENKNEDDGRQSHFMSMTDALMFARNYEISSQIEINRNVNEFKSFLLTDQFIDPDSGRPFTNHAERVHITPPWGGESGGDDEEGGRGPSQGTGGGGEDLPQFGPAVNVSSYEHHGEFLIDYVGKTLPHVLSCVRRIPSYLSAPSALQSPYMLVAPSDVPTDYLNGELCRQGYRKAEDFVYRFMTPKITFESCGYTAINSKSSIKDSNQNIISQYEITTVLKSFETKFYRTQEDFEKITDWDDDMTHKDIKIGPEFVDRPLNPTDSIQPSPYLGFVGLNDFEDDLLHEPYMNLSDEHGYRPQIVLNFNPYENNGLSNSSDFNNGHDPQKPNKEDDLWMDAYANEMDSLIGSEMEGSDLPTLADSSQANAMSDLSPFGGARFLSLGHGEFSENGFADSLYWRLHPWMDANTPVGQDLSSGVMTFWFQMPSGYPFPTRVKIGPNNDDVIEPTSFTRVLVSLNLWERFEFRNLFPNQRERDTITRPVSLTVGLKTTPDKHLVFARYDSGSISHIPNGSVNYHYTGPIGFLSSFQALQSSVYNNNAPIFDALNFWCDHDSHGSFQEEKPLNYQNYRSFAHRSSEVAIALKDKAASPGFWHRVSVFWRLGYVNSLENKANQQLYITLHDNEFKKVNDPIDNEFFQGVTYAPTMYRPGDSFGYPDDPETNTNNTNSHLGFCMPFSTSMVLALGEAHGQRMAPYQLKDTSPSTSGFFYPYWRLNSTIDNFRLYIGPSNPNTSPIDPQYFENDFILRGAVTNLSNYIAMRYNITRDAQVQNAFDEDLWEDAYKNINEFSEPTWVINPYVPKNSRLLSLDAQIYDPVGSGSSGYRNENQTWISVFNRPTIELSANTKNDLGQLDQILYKNYQDYDQFPDLVDTENFISNDEHSLKYDRTLIDENFRIALGYKAIKSSPNGDPREKLILGNKLWYVAKTEDEGSQGQNVTNISWIEEIALRYIPQGDLPIIKWEEQ